MMTCRDHDPALFDACKAAEDAEMATYLRPVRAEVARLRMPIVSASDPAPALERWRQWVLDNPKRRSPLEVAAAWELTAIDCERRGESEHAIEARQSAYAQQAQAA